MKNTVGLLLEKISSEAQNICTAILNDGQIESEVFEDALIFEDAPELPNPLRGKKGIYVFIMTEEIQLERASIFTWNYVKGAGFINGLAQTINEGDCLYLGSCVSKSLHSRIREHYAANGEFTALKLRHPKRNVLFGKVKVFVFRIKPEYSEPEYRIILPAIEKRLHEMLTPKTGSSRT